MIVVGAGPAGSIAAREAARGGLKVLLVEKRQEIGSPVRCAEGVSRADLARFGPIEPRWICAQIGHYLLHSPNGATIKLTLKDAVYILERKIFDRDLANQAALAGAQVLAKTVACGLLFGENGSITGVKLRDYRGTELDVKARIVVGADGVESEIGRWAGINTVPHLHDIHSTAQYLLAGLNLPDDTSHFYFGSAVTPGGYAWVFPKGNGTANVGVGVAGSRPEPASAQTYLDRFVDQNFASASILGVVVGGVPLSGTLGQIVKDGLMLVGDAAHQAYPHTGGGIENAMQAGALAGQVAVQAIRAGDCSGQFLSQYARAWNQSMGRRLSWSYRVKKMLSVVDDATLNKAVAIMSRFAPGTVTVGKVLLVVALTQPGLLLTLVAKR